MNDFFVSFTLAAKLFLPNLLSVAIRHLVLGILSGNITEQLCYKSMGEIYFIKLLENVKGLFKTPCKLRQISIS